MITARIQLLADKFFGDGCTPSEKEELAAWVGQGSRDTELRELLERAWLHHQPLDSMPEAMAGRIVAGFFADKLTANTQLTADATLTADAPPMSALPPDTDPLPLRRPVPWIRFAAAAAILGILLTGAWLLVRQRPVTSLAARPAPPPAADIAPGGGHATLTLAGGTTILLDSAHNGRLVRQGNTEIIKGADGRLTYHPGKNAAPGTTYNSIRIPRGGFYQLGLPDGTRVWLNAASSLRFPTAFTGGSREVDMTGEAYFDIAPDPAHPFIVHAGKTRTTVLGTVFNINAYDDEPGMRTTLLEGSVRFDGGAGSKLLRPGQQARYDAATGSLIIRPADTAAVVAWKNGQFPLDGTDMAALMRQLARWYDVDVQFDGPMPDRKFGGSISRNVNLSAVLEALKQNGVDCRLDGKTIRVTR